MNSWIPLNTPALPAERARPDPTSEDLHIEFLPASYGRVKVYVYDEYNFIIDILFGQDFQDAYDSVSEEYPQASWRPPKN